MELTNQVEKKKVRFHMEMDIFLLKEVLDANPYANHNMWKDLAAMMAAEFQQPFNARNVRERVEYLLKVFTSKERSVIRKSGSEEQYCSRDLLLEDVKTLRNDFKTMQSNRLRKDETNEAKRLRDEAAHAQLSQLTDVSHEGTSATIYVDTANDNVDTAIRDTANDNVDTAIQDTANDVDVEEIVVEVGELFAPFSSSSSSDSQTQIEPVPLNSASSTSYQRPQNGSNDGIIERGLPVKRSPHTRKTVTDFLQVKHQADHEHRMTIAKLRQEEIENERRRIAMEEKRLALQERSLAVTESTQLKIIDLLNVLVNKFPK